MTEPRLQTSSKANQVLEMAKRASVKVEIYSVDTVGRSVVFEANRLKEIQSSETSGLAVRVISNGRLGATATTDLRNADKLLERAIALSKFGPGANFDFPSMSQVPSVKTFDGNVGNLSPSQMIETASGLVERLRERWEGALCEAHVRFASGSLRVLNSSGLASSAEFSGYSVLLAAQIIKDTDMLHVWSGHTSRGLFGSDELDQNVFHPVDTAIARSQRIAKTPPSGTPVIFTPRGVASAFAEPLLEGFNGQKIADKSSPITGRWGERIAGEGITLRDNPLIDMNSEARGFDDEGVACGVTTLLDKGIAVSPLLDLRSAAELGMASTGSARRSLSGIPSPSPSTLEMLPGSVQVSELSKGGKAVIVEDLLGAGQSNTLGGEFRANLSLGYLAEDGEVVGRLKNILISGNVYNSLSKVEGLSKEREWVFGSLLAPYIRCGGVQVAGGDG